MTLNDFCQSQGSAQQVPVHRAAYVAPELRVLGDIRDLTLGGSLGTGDSGSPRTQRR